MHFRDAFVNTGSSPNDMTACHKTELSQKSKQIRRISQIYRRHLSLAAWIGIELTPFRPTTYCWL